MRPSRVGVLVREQTRMRVRLVVVFACCDATDEVYIIFRITDRTSFVKMAALP